MNKDKHNILEILKDYGYTVIDHQPKVRYLGKSIKTTDIDLVKTRIMSDESLRQDFYGCVTLYKDFVKQSSAENTQVLVIATSGTNNDSGKESVTFDPKERYCVSNE